MHFCYMYASYGILLLEAGQSVATLEEPPASKSLIQGIKRLSKIKHLYIATIVPEKIYTTPVSYCNLQNMNVQRGQWHTVV